MSCALTMGAVAYDPKVVTIWEGFKRWFDERGLAFDFVLFSNYESQVEAHFGGQFDVAWNSPLAWLQTEHIASRIGRKAEAIAMRDSDRDLTSVIVVRSDAKIQNLDDLRGKTVAVGACDSPQATLIPLLHLAEAGLDPSRAVELRRFDVLVGKHGDHVGGERDAAKCLIAGDADAACMIDANHYFFGKDGTLPPGRTRILAQTEDYDHCNFTILDGAPEEGIARFRELLHGMSYDDAELRPLLKLEGLKRWEPGRTEKYALLDRALSRFGTTDAFVDGVVARFA